MKVAPFGSYQPDERRGEVYATEFITTDVNGKTFFSYAVVDMSDSGDSCGIGRGYDTLIEAEVAAYLLARGRNAVFIPSSGEQWA